MQLIRIIRFIFISFYIFALSSFGNQPAKKLWNNFNLIRCSFTSDQKDVFTNCTEKHISVNFLTTDNKHSYTIMASEIRICDNPTAGLITYSIDLDNEAQISSPSFNEKNKEHSISGNQIIAFNYIKERHTYFEQVNSLGHNIICYVLPTSVLT